MHLTYVIMATTLAAVFVATGLPKLLRLRPMRDRAGHLGYSPAAFQAIGAAELAASAGLSIGTVHPWIGIAGG